MPEKKDGEEKKKKDSLYTTPKIVAKLAEEIEKKRTLSIYPQTFPKKTIIQPSPSLQQQKSKIKPIGQPVQQIKQISKSPVVQQTPKVSLLPQAPIPKQIQPQRPATIQKPESPEKQSVSAKKESPKDIISEVSSEIKQQVQKQRTQLLTHLTEEKQHPSLGGGKEEFVKTGIPGFDELLKEGIPKGSSMLVAGGAGSGKTIFCLQTMYAHASHGEPCLYMSFEENEGRLREHMEDFNWFPLPLERKNLIKIQRINPFDITRSVDALLAKAKGELLIDIDPVILPLNFKPSFVFVDSLTAIASAFTGKEESYRIYIEQLFRFLEKIGATSFLITETEQIPKIFSKTGVEEFLADGVIVLYNLKHGNVRENAVEILKLRGAAHEKKIVAFQITSKGIIVYPEQEVFAEIE
jgi:KaiC/GvpD/RAD55 family RecA-like ATPase